MVAASCPLQEVPLNENKKSGAPQSTRPISNKSGKGNMQRYPMSQHTVRRDTSKLNNTIGSISQEPAKRPVTTNRPVSGRPFIHARPANRADPVPNETRQEAPVEPSADLDFDMLGDDDQHESEMGQHLVKPDNSDSTLSNPAAFNDTPQGSTHITSSV